MTPPISPGPAAAATPSMLGELQLRLAHRLGDDVVEHLDMGAGGDLRHHAAEGGVLVDLRQDDIGQDPAAAGLRPLDHRRRGLVAGRLDAEHDHRRSINPVARSSRTTIAAFRDRSRPATNALPAGMGPA